jgi:hypothetical protein
VALRAEGRLNARAVARSGLAVTTAESTAVRAGAVHRSRHFGAGHPPHAGLAVCHPVLPPPSAITNGLALPPYKPTALALASHRRLAIAGSAASPSGCCTLCPT